MTRMPLGSASNLRQAETLNSVSDWGSCRGIVFSVRESTRWIGSMTVELNPFQIQKGSLVPIVGYICSSRM